MKLIYILLVGVLALSSCTINRLPGYEVYMKAGSDMSILSCDSIHMQSNQEALLFIKGRRLKIYAEQILISN
jgi:hypothetical protein